MRTISRAQGVQPLIPEWGYFTCMNVCLPAPEKQTVPQKLVYMFTSLQGCAGRAGNLQ